MATSTSSTNDTKTLRYVGLGLLGLLGLGLAGIVLVLLYFSFSYLALNLFLGLDLSLYGRVGGPLGYGLLGLGLGAAAGAVAAQRRYRLHRGLRYGAGALGLVLLGLAAVPGQASRPPAPAPAEAKAYVIAPTRVSCASCTAVAASSTRPAQAANSYEAGNLLRRDSTTAWISAAGVDADNPLLPELQLRFTIAPLAGHRLMGLRLRNGYCKNGGVYQSFGRLKTCVLRVGAGPAQGWALPDAPHQEFLLPLAVPIPPDSTHVTLVAQESYPGDNHPEVAIAWLVPVFEPLAPEVTKLPKPSSRRPRR